MTPKPSQSWPPVLLLAVILLMSLATTTEQQPTPRITLPGCPDKCGNISIPYPFGTKDGCFLPGFNVTCNDTFYPPRPFIADGKVFKRAIRGYYPTDEAYQAQKPITNWDPTPSPMELIGVSVGEGEARVYGALSSLCIVRTTYRSFLRQVLWVDSPFHFSGRNVLIGIGLNADCRLTTSTVGTDGAGIISCVSRPNLAAVTKDGACMGQGCCEAASTKALNGQIVVVADRVSYTSTWTSDHCCFGMFVEKDWYNYTSEDVYGDEAYFAERFPRGVPLVLDFAIGNGSCPAEGQPRPQGYACLSENSSCIDATDVPGYRCRCRDGYEGNPYVATGCQDINECMDNNNCTGDHQTCINTLGSYYCACKRGTRLNGQTCTEIFPLLAKVVVGAIGGILIMTVLIFIVLLRKEKRNMREFFVKNGGPTLERAKTIKIFKKEELMPFLKKNNFIGKGSFGEVYRGLLGENQLVAIKKPIINVSVVQNEQFANEVIIQSQVIHKNIVKLIGCCLEVDIPMLVYEFVSKGSLDDNLHGSTGAPLNLGVRLNIAAESAEGLAYMHSGTTTTVLHGDVKPANILLNDSYVPKISDFGISKLINKDIAQHTDSVIGDRSYMDPVYLQTGLLTDKSDVYSFGVVLLELVSRKKATYSDNNSLVRNFVDAYTKDKRATELFDMEIAVASDMELLDCLAGIAVECLNLDVDQRPEMTDIAERLLVLKRSRNK